MLFSHKILRMFKTNIEDQKKISKTFLEEKSMRNEKLYACRKKQN